MKTVYEELPEGVSLASYIVDEGMSGRLSSTVFRCNSGRVIVEHGNLMKSALTGELMTRGAAVCEYLRMTGKRKHLATAEQYASMIKRAPIYSRPSRRMGWEMWDIRGAYPEIYRRLRWDDELICEPERIVLKGRNRLSDFPYLDDKITRSALVGISFGGNSYEVEEGYIVSRRQQFSFVNPHLINIIYTVLHDIASRAISLGAIYWNTDGGIMSPLAGLVLSDYCTKTWGLELRKKLGPGLSVVRGVGAYRVGDYRSHPYNESKNMQHKYIRKPEEQAIMDSMWLLGVND